MKKSSSSKKAGFSGKFLFVVIALMIVFMAAFIFFLFYRTGYDVYVVSVTGNVSVGNTSDLNAVNKAAVGMKLDEGNIIMTGERSSCVLAYKKDATVKDDYITIGADSQVNVYGKNPQGGYNFFVTYGSVISNMANNGAYRTNISSKLYNFAADNAIAKVSYDAGDKSGKIFVFDGNPTVQVIQPSGTVNNAEKLVKNSVCAVRSMDDGTIGFGCLNTAFGLNSLTAQDLKIMSGIANNWAERISYSVSEFEQAFQTAADYSDYAQTEPVTITTTAPVETTTVPSESTVTSTEISIATTVPPETSATIGTTTTTRFMGAVQTIPGLIDAEETQSDNRSTVILSEFTRQTVEDLGDVDFEGNDTPTVTTVPVDTPSTSASSRSTSAYTKVPEESTVSSSVSTKPATTTKPVTSQASTSKTTVISSKPAVSDVEHTVIFTYSENGVEYWSVQLVKHGTSAIPPDVPEIPGKRFVKWDADYSNVVSDMTINGVFEDGDSSAVNHTVHLFVNDILWRTVVVKHGDDIHLTEKPESSDKKLVFSGWSDSLNNIESDKIIFALFTEK